jgi:hypothetical protein
LTIEMPTRSSDSRHIYFMPFLNGPGVFRIPITGGDAELVAGGAAKLSAKRKLFSRAVENLNRAGL